MKKLIAANWKENPKTETQALRLFREVAKEKRGASTEVVICAPAIFIDELSHAFRAMRSRRGFALGAEDVFWEEAGPFTGTVGPKMLRSLGVTHVIVGHSERRKWMRETDAMVNKKLLKALGDGLVVILCVGEALAVRKKGAPAARRFVAAQLRRDLRGVRAAKLNSSRVVIAYEPIWAIGTGRHDMPEDAREMAAFIKKTAGAALGGRAPRVLYGGSTNSGNIADYVQYKEIDGALVGGASLKAGEFKKMIKITTLT